MMKNSIQIITARRSVSKLANINKYNNKSSAWNFKPKKNVQPGMYQHVSPSLSSPLQKTPNAFLPKSDARKASASKYSAEDVSFMPALSPENNEKKYHLTAEQVNEIRTLRAQDPYKYTRKVLAKQFECSEHFIGMVADTPVERINDMNSRLDTIRSMWSKGRAEARLDREKRKSDWYSNI